MNHQVSTISNGTKKTPAEHQEQLGFDSFHKNFLTRAWEDAASRPDMTMNKDFRVSVEDKAEKDKDGNTIHCSTHRTEATFSYSNAKDQGEPKKKTGPCVIL